MCVRNGLYGCCMSACNIVKSSHKYVWWSCCWSHVYLRVYSTRMCALCIFQGPFSFMCVWRLHSYTHLDMLVNVGFCLFFLHIVGAPLAWIHVVFSLIFPFLLSFCFWFFFDFFYLSWYYFRQKQEKMCVRISGEYTINKLLLVCSTRKTTHWQYYMYKFT